MEISGINKSTYHYQINHYDNKKNKDEELLELIKQIFTKNRGKYGYPRITMELKALGYKVNKKRVERIMRENGIRVGKKKRKYISYRGDVGKTADNILERNFETTKPYEKLGTDITMFITQFGRLYFSPIIDFHTREILAYDLSETPDFGQIKRMMWELLKTHGSDLKESILHSDQGWQYQMLWYQKKLKDLGIIQSMSRKGNCLDNSPTENLFGRMKVEMFYDREGTFESMEQLKDEIHKYVKYYNEDRIVSKLKTSPIKYRTSYYNEYISI